MSAVRLSFDRFKSMGNISSCPLISTGIEQMMFLSVCSSSFVSVKPKVEFGQDITHEYECASFDPLIQSSKSNIILFDETVRDYRYLPLINDRIALA